MSCTILANDVTYDQARGSCLGTIYIINDRGIKISPQARSYASRQGTLLDSAMEKLKPCTSGKTLSNYNILQCGKTILNKNEFEFLQGFIFILDNEKGINRDTAPNWMVVQCMHRGTLLIGN